MWIFLYKQAISFLKSLQCLKCWTIKKFPVTPFQISHKATWQTTRMFSKHLSVDSSFTAWKMQETDSLQFCWVHILTIERSTCVTVLWPNMGKTPYRGWKRKKKSNFQCESPSSWPCACSHMCVTVPVLVCTSSAARMTNTWLYF